MYFFDSLLSAVSLAMDASAVALCVGAGISGDVRGASLRFGATCGAFQFFMPFIGWYLGAYAINLIASFDHWVAFALLAFVGGNMIRGSFADNRCYAVDPTKSLSLLYIAIATSIDALAIGASFAITDRPVFLLAAGAGIVTLVLCCLGVIFGRSAGAKLGGRVEFAGGVILFVIGLNILREHLF
jgi:putative Mn2+ efflux pump MntP